MGRRHLSPVEAVTHPIRLVPRSSSSPAPAAMPLQYCVCINKEGQGRAGQGIVWTAPPLCEHAWLHPNISRLMDRSEAVSLPFSIGHATPRHAAPRTSAEVRSHASAAAHCHAAQRRNARKSAKTSRTAPGNVTGFCLRPWSRYYTVRFVLKRKMHRVLNIPLSA